MTGSHDASKADWWLSSTTPSWSSYMGTFETVSK